MFLSAIFSGFETAFVTLDKFWLHGKLESGVKRAHILDYLVRHSDDTLGAFLVGTNFSDVATVICFVNFLNFCGLGENLTQIILAIILTPAIYLFSTLIPKVIFKEYANEICLDASFILLLIYILLYPFQIVFTLLGKIILAILRKDKRRHFSREDFALLIDSRLTKEILKESERDFIKKVISFKEIKAKELMMPLIRMPCVEINEPVKIAIALMGATGLSRLPVFDMRVDNMVGFVEIKDLIGASKNELIREYVKKGIYVTEFTPMFDILFKMKEEKTHMAFVVDEYGGVTGVITNQDVLKELLGGEFQERSREDLITKADGYWLINGIIGIEDLNEELKLNIEKDDFETLAGFIISKLKRIPKPGEKLEYKGYIFEVYSATPVRIRKVKVYKKRRGRVLKNE